MSLPTPASKKLIDEKKKLVTDAVEDFNCSHKRKLVLIKEEPFPHATEAIIGMTYSYNGRELIFVGCRTLPCFVIEQTGNGTTKEFMDEFLETLN